MHASSFENNVQVERHWEGCSCCYIITVTAAPLDLLRVSWLKFQLGLKFFQGLGIFYPPLVVFSVAVFVSCFWKFFENNDVTEEYTAYQTLSLTASFGHTQCFSLTSRSTNQQRAGGICLSGWSVTRAHLLTGLFLLCFCTLLRGFVMWRFNLFL